MEQPKIVYSVYYVAETAKKGMIWIYVFGRLADDTFDCLVLDANDTEQLIPRALSPRWLVNEVPEPQVPITLRQMVANRRRIPNF